MRYEIPWRQGVLALARYEGRVWMVREAVLIKDEDGDIVRAWVAESDYLDWWEDEGPDGGLETVRLPDQCRACLEIEEHADDCPEEAEAAAVAAFLSAAQACSGPMAGASELEALRLAWEALPVGVRRDPMGFTRWGSSA